MTTVDFATGWVALAVVALATVAALETKLVRPAAGSGPAVVARERESRT